MEFFGLDKNKIRKESVLTDGYYMYTIGSKIEVTTIKKRNSNTLLSSSLSSNKKEDKMMVRYYPNNTILFDIDFIEDDNDSNLASCFIDVESCRVFVGKEGKYEVNYGVLSFTGVLSLNNMVQDELQVYSNSQISDKDTKSKVRLLSVGVLGDSLFGLYFIPKERGLAISSLRAPSKALSIKTWRTVEVRGWSKLKVDDWFASSKIEVIDEEGGKLNGL